MHHSGNYIPVPLSPTLMGQIPPNLRIRYNSCMSQWISTKSGQKGADVQKSVIVHRERTESTPVFPPLDLKEAKD